MIKVAFLGDICLQHKDLRNKSWGKDDISPSLKEFVEKIDFSVANLENPLGGDEASRNKEKLALRASSNTIPFLKTLNVHAVSLANNHIVDYGDKGGLETVNLLEEAGIKWFGAGYLGEEGNPTILERNGISLACLGYSHPPCEEWYSSTQRFGSAQYVKSELEYLISQLKGSVNSIFVFMHWGLENINYPVPENVKVAHEIIDLGADVIIGGHPHLYQGYEIYRGKYIFYSLGNFVFGDIVAKTLGDQTYRMKQSLRNRISLVPVFSISKHNLILDDIDFFHFRKDNTIVKLTGLKKWLHSCDLNRLSVKLGVDLSKYERWWQRNIKVWMLFKYVEQAIFKEWSIQPGKRYIEASKRLLTQNVKDFG